MPLLVRCRVGCQFGLYKTCGVILDILPIAVAGSCWESSDVIDLYVKVFGFPVNVDDIVCIGSGAKVCGAERGRVGGGGGAGDVIPKMASAGGIIVPA